MKACRDLFSTALLVLAVFALSFTNRASAASYTFDAGGLNGISGTPADGSDLWSTSSANWWTGLGAGDINWTTSADSAWFGATPGSSSYTVTLGSNVATAGITFASQNYTIASSTYGVSIGSGGITANPGATGATISAPITLLAPQQWVNNSSGGLTVTSNITSGGNLLTIGGSGTTTIGARLNGTNGLTVGPASTLVVTTSSGYTGPTTINGGVLTLQAPTLATTGAPAPLVWFDPSNPSGYTLTSGSVSTLINLSTSSTAGNAGIESGHGEPTLTLANPAFNGMNTLHFNGSSALGGFNLSALNGTSYTIFTIEGVAASGNYYYLGSNAGATNEGMHIGYVSAGEFHLGQYGNDLNTASGAVPYTGTEVAREWTTSLNTAVGHSINMNGQSLATNTNTTGFNSLSSMDYGIIGAGFSYSDPFLGDLGEVLIYNSALTAAQTQSVEAYLQAKWELNGVLPATTPVTISSGGTLNLNGVSQTLGSLTSSDPTTHVQLNAFALTTGNDNTNTTFAGAISGSGQLIKIGGGMFTMSGSNTYTGATTLSAGTLQFQGNTALSSSSAINLNTGLLQFRNDGSGSGGTISVGNSITLSSTGSAISATINVGNLVSSNTGNTVAFGALNNGVPGNNLSSTINFTGANGYVQTYTGLGLAGNTGNGTTLNPTTASVIIAGPVTNQETSFSTHFDTMTLAGSSTGNAITGPITDSSGYISVGNGDTRLTVNASNGAWTLTGSNTFHGPITLTAGTLTIGGAGYLGGGTYGGTTASTSASTFTNNGVFVMNTSSNQTFGGVISGTGTFYQLGSNVTTLTNANTYSGLTTIGGGTLQIGAGSNAGSIAGAVLDNGVLAIARSDSVTVANAISGSGSVYQIGSGSLTVTGSNAFSGTAFVNTGSLFINGTNSTTAISVAGGATLGGSGSYTSATATVANGGNVTAGYGGSGRLTLGGLTFSNSGNINVANVGNYSLLPAINVTGSNALNANGGANSDTIALSGLVPAASYADLHLLQYSGTLGGGFSSFALTTSGISNLSPLATLTLTATDAGYVDVIYSTDSLVWTGSGDGTTWSTAVQSPSNWKLLSNGNQANFLTFDPVIFNDSAGSNTTISISGSNVAPSLVTFNNNTSAYFITGSNGITGPASLVINGSGSVTISTSNNYTGGTVLNAGLLNISNSAALGSGTLTLNGGSFDNTSGVALTLAPNIPQIWNGNFAFVGSNPLNLGTGAVTLTASTTLNVGGGLLTVGGVIAGNGYSLTETGAGTLLLTGANTFNGNTLVASGTLLLGNASALQDSTVDTSGGGTLSFGTLTSATFGNLVNGGSLTLSNTASAAVALSVGNNGFSSSYSGTLGGNGSLSKIGAGTLYLSGSNNYTGTTMVSAGTLNLSGALTNTAINVSGGNFTQGPSGVISGSGGFTLSSGTAVLGGTNSYIGATTISAGTLQYQGNTALSVSSAINLGSATLQVRSDGAGNGGTIGVGGNITLSAATTTDFINVNNLVTSNTGNTVAFGVLSNGTSANAYTSTFNFTGGNGYLQSFSALNLSGLGGGPTTLNPTTTSVTITGNVTNQESGGVSGHYDTLLLEGSSTGNVISGVIADNSAYASVGNGDTRLQLTGTGGAWTLTGSNTFHGPIVNITGGTLTIGGAGYLGGGNYANTILNNAAFVMNTSSNQILGGVISGTGAFYQLGSGSTTLNAVDTYSGTTTIGGGVLALASSASINSTPTIAISNGATFNVTAKSGTYALLSTQTLTGTGNNYVAGTMTLNSGATVLPGGATSAGTLNVSALTLSTGSILKFDLGSGQDLINVTNSAGLTVNGGGVDLYQSNGSSQFTTVGTYTLMDYAGALGGAPGDLSVLNPNLSESYVFSTSGSALVVTITNPIGWNGGAGSPFNWSNSGNWSGSQAPSNGSSVTFTGSTGLTNNNDLTNLNVAGLIFSSTAGAFNLSGNSIQISGAIANLSTATQTIGMNVGLSGGNQSIIASAGNIAVNGVISDGGAGYGINLTGSAAITLAAANTYSGPTNVTAGTLNVAHPLAVQYSTVNLAGGAMRFAAGITSPTLGGLSGSGNIALATAASEPVALGVGNNALNTTYGGALSGPGSLVKLGTGTLTLTSSQTYIGPTLISGGVLKLQGGNSIGINFIGSGSSVTASDGPPGAVMSNWNNLSGSSPSGVNLVNNLGIPTTGSIITSSGNSGTSSAGSSDVLLNGYIYKADGTITATLTGIPYANYNLYAFSEDSTAGHIDSLTLAGTTYYFTAESDSTFDLITNTNSASDPSGNYAVATGLTGGSQAVSISSAQYTGFSGFEIVNTAPPAGLPSTTPLAISNGSTFDMTNFTQTVLSLSSTDGMGSKVLVGSGALTIAGPAVTTFDGVISGAGGGLALQSGMLTLTGSNTYTGATTLSGGTLQLGTGGSGFDGSLATSSITNQGALVYNIFGTQTANYAVSGSGSLSMIGPGQVTLAASSNYTGATTVLAGTLSLGATGSIAQSPTISVGNGATFDVSQVSNYHLVSGQTLTGTGNFTVNGAMTANSGSFILSASTGLARTLNVGSLTLSPGSVVNYDIGSGSQDLINVVNYGGLTVNGGSVGLYQGNGTSPLSAAGTYALMTFSGGVSGAAGNLLPLNPIIGDVYAFTASGGSLDVTITSPDVWTGGAGYPNFNWSNGANWANSQAPTSGNPITFAGSVGPSNTNDIAGLNVSGMIFSSSAAAFNLSGNSIQLSGAIVNLSTATQTIGLNLGLSGTSQTINAAAGNIVVSGVISDGGANLGLNLTGSGAVSLAAANTYTGPTNVSSGTLNLAHPLAVQYSTVNMAGGALGFAAGITSPTLGGLSGSGNIALATAASEPVALGVGNNGLNSAYAGILSGAGSLVKQGLGTLTLSASQVYSGPTRIIGGVLQLQNGGGPTSGGIGIQFVGGGTSISGTAGVYAIGNWNLLTGQTWSNYALINSSGAATTAKLTATADGTYDTGQSNPLLNGYINNNSSDTLTISLTGIPYSSYSIYAYMTDTSAYDEHMTIGSQTYYYSMLDSSTFTQVTNTTAGTYPPGNYVLATGLVGGSQTINVYQNSSTFASLSGIEIVNTAAAGSGNLPATTPLSISNGSTFDMTNSTQTVLSLSSTDGMGSQVLLGNGALTITGPAVTTFDGVISGGGGAVTLQGGGLTLTGQNIYTGATTVSGGALQLNSSGGPAVAGNLAVSGGTAALLQSNQLSSTASVSVSAGFFNIGANSNTVAGVQITGGTISGTTGVLTSTTDYNAQNGAVSAILGGSVNLDKTTGGTVVLAGANTYSGSTNVTAGTLSLAHPLAVQYSTVNMAGGALGFAAGITSPTLGGLTGYSNIALATAASESVALGVGSNGQSTTYAGILSGAGGLSKQGSGTLTLNSLQSYAGPTLVSGGVLQLQAPAASIGVHFESNGSNAVPVTGLAGVAPMSNWMNFVTATGVNYSNQALTNNSGGTTTATLTTTGLYGGAGATNGTNPLLNNYIYINTNDITNTGNALSATLSGIPYSSYSIYAYFSDSNTAGYEESLGLNGQTYYYSMTTSPSFIQVANTSSASYPAGDYVVATGLSGSSQTVSVTAVSSVYGSLCALEIVNTGPGGSGSVLPATTPVTISGGGTLDMTNLTQTIASLSSTDGMGSQVLMGSGVLTITGPAVTTFDGVISDGGAGGSLVLQGGGLTLTGSNTYSGATTIGSGTLQLGNGANGHDGSIANTSGVNNNGALAYNLFGSQTAAYAISGTGAVNKSGPGTLTLTNPGNSYTGGTNVQGGLLVIALNSSAFASTYGPLNVSGGSMDLEGNIAVVQSLNGNGTIGNGASGSANEAMLYVEGGGNFSGVIQDGGFGGNAPVSLELDGGTLVLSGTGEFSGGTTVDGGTLILETPTALADGSTLIVGTPGEFFFGAVPAEAPSAAAPSGVAAVPEPGTLALFAAAGIAAAAGVWRRKFRPRLGTSRGV